MDGEFRFPELTAESESWLNTLMPEFAGENAIGRMLEGSFGADIGSFAGRLMNLFFGELRLSMRILALLLAMAVFLAVIRNMQSSFGRDGVGSAANLAATVYLTAIALGAFASARGCASGAVDDLCLIMDSMLPATLTLMISGGMSVSAGAVHPVIYFMCSLMSKLVRSAIIPLALASLTFRLLDGISEGVDISGPADLCQRVGRWLLGFVMVMFTGVLSITKFAASSFDDLAARGLKFAVSAAVPVVGGSIAEAMSSVAGGSLLLKNSIGAVGVALIIGTALLPVIKIGALSLMFRVGGALMGPMGGGRAAGSVYAMADCLETLVAAVSCVAVMMVISVAALLA